MNLIDSLFYIAFEIVWAFSWAVILRVVFNLLEQFNVIDTRNQMVRFIGSSLERFTDPILDPIRRIVPYFNGIDLSPWIAVLLLRYPVPALLNTLRNGIVFGTWSL